MVTLLKLVRLEVVSALRALVPQTWLRRSMVVLFVTLVAVLCSISLIVPMPQRQAEVALTRFAGLLIANLAVGVPLATLAAATLLRTPEESRVGLLAPISPTSAVWLRIAPVPVLVLTALAVFYAPFVVFALRIAPGFGLGLALLGAAIAAWSVQVALWFTLQLARRQGRERASRTAQTLAFASGALAVSSFSGLLRAAHGAIPFGFLLAASVGVLPWWIASTARSFHNTLTNADPPQYGRHPCWGRPSWWSLLRGYPLVWFLSSALTIVVLQVSNPPLRWGMTTLVLIASTLAPLGRLMTAEYRRPDRWRLSPLAGRVKRSLLVEVGLPCSLCAAAVGVVLGWGASRWLIALAVLVVLGPPTCLITRPLPRQVAQSALLILALATDGLR